MNNDKNKLIEKANLIIEVKPNVDKGFHFGYILFIPNGVIEKSYLIVEGAYSGKHEEMEEARREIYYNALTALSPGYNAEYFSTSLKFPLLYPLFPQTYYENKKLNVQEYSNDMINMEFATFKKLDLQLLSMVDDAKERLHELFVDINDKIVLDGFGSSAHFVHRFTILHPEKVACVSGGGNSGYLTIPLEQMESRNLSFPIGVYRVDTFDFNNFALVNQFYYMGTKDEYDSTIYEDSLKKDEKDLLDLLLGSKMMPERWNKITSIYSKLNLKKVVFKTYENMDHSCKVAREDILNFIKKNTQ